MGATHRVTESQDFKALEKITAATFEFVCVAHKSVQNSILVTVLFFERRRQFVDRETVLSDDGQKAKAGARGLLLLLFRLNSRTGTLA